MTAPVPAAAPGPDTAPQLTARQESFCYHLVIGLSATEAALRAGFSRKCAAVHASRMLRNAKILFRVAQIRRDNAALIGAERAAFLARLEDLYQTARSQGTLADRIAVLRLEMRLLGLLHPGRPTPGCDAGADLPAFPAPDGARHPRPFAVPPVEPTEEEIRDAENAALAAQARAALSLRPTPNFDDATPRDAYDDSDDDGGGSGIDDDWLAEPSPSERLEYSPPRRYGDATKQPQDSGTPA